MEAYMNELGIGCPEELKRLTLDDIKVRIHALEVERWRENLGKKPSIAIYQREKQEIREEIFYNNTYGSVLMFTA